MPANSYTVTVSAHTRYEVTATAFSCGTDYSVTVCGGTLFHVGAVAVAYPINDSLEVVVDELFVPEHKDHFAARIFAEHMAKMLGCNISVSAGIHIDDATKDEIELLLKNCRLCCDLLIHKVKHSKSSDKMQP